MNIISRLSNQQHLSKNKIKCYRKKYSAASVKNTRDIIQRKQERDPIVVNYKIAK